MFLPDINIKFISSDNENFNVICNVPNKIFVDYSFTSDLFDSIKTIIKSELFYHYVENERRKNETKNL